VAALFAARMDFQGSRPVFWLMLGFIALPVMQLLPLPQSVWSNFPGRTAFYDAAAFGQGDSPWRPIAISPGATLNALSSLIIPSTVLVLVTSLKSVQRTWLTTLLLLLFIASVLVGLLQFSGAGFDNPLINYMPGSVSGTFANRNHFAILLALGCLIAPVWAVTWRDQITWRMPFAIGMVLLAALTILASGSRAGIAIGTLALILGPIVIHEDVGRLFRNAPRWVMPSTITILVAAVFALVVISVVSGRATSIDRLTTVEIGEDMRSLGLPTVFEIIRTNFPFGVGMGGFDASFRISEPFGILRIFYFNHVHNDWLELILETGVLGIVLITTALFWWVKASVRVWRHSKSSSDVQVCGRLGSAMILLILLASAVDYPTRTPLMMAFIVIAACWLTWGERAVLDGASLPAKSRSL
jgi:O-antigen ligase